MGNYKFVMESTQQVARVRHAAPEFTAQAWWNEKF